MNQNPIINQPESFSSVRTEHPSEVIADSGFLLEDTMEIWKDIKGWDGLYQISNHGRLKSFLKDPHGYIRSIKHGGGWYLTAVLTGRGRKSKTKRIHNLVAEHFIPNPFNRNVINHIDLNKQNNHYLNLEWVTTKGNYNHAVENGIDFQAGMNRYNKFIRPCPVLQVSISGKIISKFNNCKEAGKITGICARNIHQVASKTEYKPGLIRSQAGGFKWRFYGD